MSKYIFALIFLFTGGSCMSQTIYAVINLKGEFAGISHARQYAKEEFRPSVLNINGTWKIDLVYKAKRLAHRISIESSGLDKNFKIINKFLTPDSSNQLGFVDATFGTGIDHLIIGYCLQKEARKEKGFLFHSRIRFNYSFGLGFSFNRSAEYYRQVYPSSGAGWQTPNTYEAYEALHYKDGFGVFLKGSGGFDFINKKGKRKLCFSLFYNQGLKDMVHYDIHYQYGYWNDPAKQVDVPKQVLRNRGTTFGFSLGFPVTIKK